MPPKKHRGGIRGRGRGRGRGSGRGRGRGMSKRQGPRLRQPSFTDTATADDSDVDGTSSTDDNVSLTRTVSTSLTPTRKKFMDEERELSLPRLKPSVIPESSTLQSLLNLGENSSHIMTDDELDHVQWELEAMLTGGIVRQNTIQDELNTFASMQFARSQQKLSKNPKLPTIRPRAAAEISPVNECRKMKVEFDPTSKDLPLNKTESANKFWSLVEPHLAHVKKEDLKWLEDLVKSYDTNKKLYEIPPLGEHYAKVWAKEELEMQKTQSACSPRTTKRVKLIERISPDVIELVNKANTSAHDSSSFAPIFQRVVASIAEHSHTSMEDVEEHFLDYDDEEKPQEMSNICKEFYAEQTVKKQLHKLGLMGRYAKPIPSPELPSSSNKSEEDSDEILNEIIKCDNALIQLREANKNHLTNLLEKCRKDYREQTIKKKLENVNNQILNFKRQQNDSWTKEKKIIQISEEDEELQLLLQKRSDYLSQLHSTVFEPNSCLSPSMSDDSESSDEELDHPSKAHIKSESSEHDADMEQNILANNECNIEENVNLNVNIKQEAVDEKIVCEEINDIEDTEHDNFVANSETVAREKIENTVDEENDMEETADEENNDQDNKTELKIEFNIKQQQVNVKEDESSNSRSGAVKPIVRQHHGKKYKKTNAVEDNQTSQMDSKKQIKQEPAEYDVELDPLEDMIDGVRRELRPRKFNDTQVFFEPYDGSSSDDSDFTDLSD